MITDAHVHVGEDLIPIDGTSVDPRPKHLLDTMDENDIDKAVLFTFETTNNEYVSSVVKEYPDFLKKFYKLWDRCLPRLLLCDRQA